MIKDNLDVLYMGHETKTMFPPGPMVSFGSVCKISSYLVRAKLYPSERSISWRQYKKRTCEACTNVTETVIFSRIVTGETIEINHELNCDDKCFICLLKCKVCKKQYVRGQWHNISEKWNLQATGSLWAFL